MSLGPRVKQGFLKWGSVKVYMVGVVEALDIATGFYEGSPHELFGACTQ